MGKHHLLSKKCPSDFERAIDKGGFEKSSVYFSKINSEAFLIFYHLFGDKNASALTVYLIFFAAVLSSFASCEGSRCCVRRG